MTAPELSIVVAVLNEEESLERFLTGLRKTLNTLRLTYELIFVDDGSTDRSKEIILSFQRGSSDVQLISFEKNAGKSEAWNAGFARARGEIIMTMDADLQNDPEDIPLFLEKIKEGYGFVNGWRRNRKDPLARKITSCFMNRSISFLTGIDVRDLACGLKAFRRQTIQDLHLRKGEHRFIPLLLHRRGIPAVEVPVRHHPRLYGRSKFKFRLFEVFSTLVENKFFRF